MVSTGEILGIEDCLYGTRLRLTTLKCVSQIGELFEISYDDLIAGIKLVESSCIFLGEFVIGREKAREKLIKIGKIRHHMSESLEKKNEHGKPKFLLKQSMSNDNLTAMKKIDSILDSHNITKNNSNNISNGLANSQRSLNNLRKLKMFNFPELSSNQTSNLGPYTNNSRIAEPLKVNNARLNMLGRLRYGYPSLGEIDSKIQSTRSKIKFAF